MSEEARARALDLLRFLDAAPSPWHAAREVARRLEAGGFARVEETDAWAPVPGARQYLVRGGSTVVAWVMGERAPEEAGFRILGAHTDSPCFRVKPLADLRAAGHRQVGVEVYGGVLWHTWLDRDLTVAGRVALRGGRTALVRFPGAIARLPSLAIHLDRSVNTQGLSLNPQNHLVPTLGLELATSPGFVELVREEVGRGGADVSAADVLGWDLCLADAAPAALGGTGGELIFAPRLDDLACCHAALSALLAAPAAHPATHVMALWDHEEVGSQSMAGAKGRLLASVLERLASGVSGATREATARALARSLLVSADMAHAQHPNYPERHDKQHAPRLAGGPVIKINAAQSYASDGVGTAVFEEACQAAGVPTQRFVSRNDQPCGSTIGPITAALLGVRTVDVGSPMLSMHSCREMAATEDPLHLEKALAQVLTHPELPPADH